MRPLERIRAWCDAHWPAAVLGTLSAIGVVAALGAFTFAPTAPSMPSCVLPALARHAAHRAPWQKALAQVALDCDVSENVAADAWDAHTRAESIEGIVPYPVGR